MSQGRCQICDYDNAEFRLISNRQGPYHVNLDTDIDKAVNCPVCGIYHVWASIDFDSRYLSNYGIEFSSESNSQFTDDQYEKNKALLRKSVYDLAPKKYPATPIKVTAKFAREVFSHDFPTPIDQVNYLIRFLGGNLGYSGAEYEYGEANLLNTFRMRSATASINDANLASIIRNAMELTLVKLDGNYISLTIHGWEKYQELKKGISDSTRVFMAMQFDDAQKEFVKNNLKPVIKKLGYDLSILSDITSEENNIDIKLRNAIRDSILLICDLTHRNNGAYFEAGFAEGLGKPVVYICEEKSFNEEDKRIHFDVAHMEIYMWNNEDKSSIEKFKDDIEAKITAMLRI
jgi:hypothetical protein